MKKRLVNKIFLNINIFLIFILGSVSIYSQPSLTDGSTIVLTLEKAVNMALEKNYDVQIANYSLMNAEAQITEAYAGAWPKLNFMGTYNRNIKLPVLFLPPNTPFNPSSSTETFSLGANNSYNIGLSLSQTIYDPRLGTAISIAKQYSQYSKLNNQSTEDDVRSQVKQAFYGTLLSKKLVEVNEEGYNVAKANKDNTEALYKQGVASEYDYLRSEVQLANIEPALIEAKNNFEMSKNNLKNLLALNLDTKVEIQGELEVEKISAKQLDDSNEILEQKNPLLQSLNIQKSMLEENISIEKAAYLPTLKAFGSYAWQSEDNTFKFKDYNWANTFSVGLQLTYTLFDGFQRGAKVEQAEIGVKSIQATKSKTEENLKIGLLQSRLKMNEALDRINAQKQSVEQAEKALKISETRYKSGVGTQLEILDTQNALSQTRINYEKAIYDFLIAKTNWEKLLGTSN